VWALPRLAKLYVLRICSAGIVARVAAAVVWPLPGLISALFNFSLPLASLRLTAVSAVARADKIFDDMTEQLPSSLLEYLRSLHSFALLAELTSAGLVCKRSLRAKLSSQGQDKSINVSPLAVLRLSAATLAGLAGPVALHGAVHNAQVVACADAALITALGELLGRCAERTSAQALKIDLKAPETDGEDAWRDVASFVQRTRSGFEGGSGLCLDRSLLFVVARPLVFLADSLSPTASQLTSFCVSEHNLPSSHEFSVALTSTKVLVSAAQSGVLAPASAWAALSKLYESLLPLIIELSLPARASPVCHALELLGALAVLARESFRTVTASSWFSGADASENGRVWSELLDSLHSAETMLFSKLSEIEQTANNSKGRGRSEAELHVLVLEALLYAAATPRGAQRLIRRISKEASGRSRAENLPRELIKYGDVLGRELRQANTAHLPERSTLLSSSIGSQYDSEPPICFPQPATFPLCEGMCDSDLLTALPVRLAWTGREGFEALVSCGVMNTLFTWVHRLLADPELTLASTLEAPQCRVLRPLHWLALLLSTSSAMELLAETLPSHHAGPGSELWRLLETFCVTTDLCGSRLVNGHSLDDERELHQQDAHRLGMLLLEALSSSPGHIILLERRLGVVTHLTALQNAGWAGSPPRLVLDSASLLRHRVLARFRWLPEFKSSAAFSNSTTPEKTTLGLQPPYRANTGQKAKSQERTERKSRAGVSLL
jgi:hypothetical protein